MAGSRSTTQGTPLQDTLESSPLNSLLHPPPDGLAFAAGVLATAAVQDQQLEGSTLQLGWTRAVNGAGGAVTGATCELCEVVSGT